MSAPILWIAVPLFIGAIALVIENDRVNAALGGVTALLLSGIALIVPIDSALLVGPISIKISSSFQILGRNLALHPADRGYLFAEFRAERRGLVVMLLQALHDSGQARP